MMARQQTTPTPSSARERAIDAYDNARERARDQLGGSPLLALGSGLAIGALVGALMPRTRAETRLMGKVGSRITTSARDALDAAKEAGREKLTELNITRDAGASAMQSLIDGLGEAARSSGQAAVDAVRSKG